MRPSERARERELLVSTLRLFIHTCLTGDFVVVVYHEIEFVEISVNEAEGGELHDQIHQIGVKFRGVLQIVDLTKRVRVHQLHHNGVPTERQMGREKKIVRVSE